MNKFVDIILYVSTAIISSFKAWNRLFLSRDENARLKGWDASHQESSYALYCRHYKIFSQQLWEAA